MNFEGDAFISYAHLDNIELVEGRKGWVANLHRALEIRVGQLLGKQPHIWRDPKLSGNDLFADTLVDQLRRVAILVTVISPRYLKSEWTIRELTEFWREAEKQGGIHVRNKARVFKVLKTPVPLDRMPQELQSLIGYDFFKVDLETGRVRELDEVFGADAHRDFWLKLDDLAHDIVALLESMEGAGVVPKGTVYLAETTSDLRDARETLKRDLLEQGFVVLPDRNLSHVASEAADAIRDALARSSLSIHLLGRHHGIVPEGGTESLGEMQYELAASEDAGSLARLVWIPDGLQLDDERQKTLLDRVRNDPRTGNNADLLETYLEDLRAAVAERLKPKEPVKAPAAAAPAETGASHPPQVYIVADVRDADALAPLVDGLFAQHVEVIPPIFDGDESEIREYHEESLVHCDGVLIFYGAGNQLWLQRRLRELQKAPGYGRTKPQPAVAVALAGPRTPEKERFRTHEATVVPQWDGFALDPLVPFLMALKAGRSA